MHPRYILLASLLVGLIGLAQLVAAASTADSNHGQPMSDDTVLIQAAPQRLEAPSPGTRLDVGKTVLDRRGRPDNAAVVKGKTSGNSRFAFEVRNVAGTDDDPIRVDDIHVKLVSPRNGVRIKSITSGSISGAPKFGPFSSTDGSKIEWKADIEDGDFLDYKEEVGLTVKFERTNGTTYPQQDAEIRIWWTKSGDHVVWFAPDRMGGNGDTLIADLAAVNTEPTVAIEGDSGAFNCPDLTIGENYNSRFQPGSFVIKPPHNYRFVHDPTVVNLWAVDEDGMDVPPSRFSASNLRVDPWGNFVFEVTRLQSDSKHIAIIISGLQIEANYQLIAGSNIYAGISCAALAGSRADDFYHLIQVAE